MNFFKSIISDDPDPSIPENPQQSNLDSEIDPVRDSSSESETADSGGGGGWNFGGLIKTLATRSESVLETYRRDLQEFGTGLKKESVIFREVASRAVKELPASIEVGASVAHGAIGGVIKSTAEIISHGKETLLSSSDVDPVTPSGLASDSSRYSRFEARLSAIQNDLNTFCEDPEDSEEYTKWKSGFVLEEKSEEVENLTGENGVLEGVYKKVVPNSVGDETFWYRYFYRVYKLMQQESVRASLVKRAISIDDEEELSWDVDDDEHDEDNNVKNKKDGDSEKKDYSNPNSPPIVDKESNTHESHEEISGTVDKTLVDKPLQHDVRKETEAELIKHTVSNVEDKNLDHVKNEDEAVKEDKKEVIYEGKVDMASTSKVAGDAGDADASSVTVKQDDVHEEEEMGWDEIENIGSDDDKKESSTTSVGKQNSDDVRKRLSTAEEDEDLSWDIEDDD